MRIQLAALLVIILSAGCVSEPPVATLPNVTCTDFDVLWTATSDVLAKRFDIYAARKEAGTIVTDYKRGEPIPAVWSKDAQTTYDTLEEVGHIVRRKATAIITTNPDGLYALKLTIIRERHSYAPPETRYASSYNLYDRQAGQLEPDSDYAESTTWTRLANDTHLEARMVGEIQKHVVRTITKK